MPRRLPLFKRFASEVSDYTGSIGPGKHSAASLVSDLRASTFGGLDSARVRHIDARWKGRSIHLSADPKLPVRGEQNVAYDRGERQTMVSWRDRPGLFWRSRQQQPVEKRGVASSRARQEAIFIRFSSKGSARSQSGVVFQRADRRQRVARRRGEPHGRRCARKEKWES